MKYAFISDIHSNLAALEAVLEDIAMRGIEPENIYNLGDSIGYGPFPNEVVALLKERNIKGLLGNYDQAMINYVQKPVPEDEKYGNKAQRLTFELSNDETLTYLRSLPLDITVDICGKKILLVHGSPRAINEYLYEYSEDAMEEIVRDYDFDILISGHTHIHYVKEVKGKIYTNSASVGKPKDDDYRAGYIVLDDGDFSFGYVKVAYDVDSTIKASNEKGLPEILGQMLELGVGKI